MPGRLTLRFLGAGGAFSRVYGTTCSLLTLPSDDLWLIDCGRQAPDQLARANLAWHRLSGQIVTHVHGDHIFGLEEFALVRYYEDKAGFAAIRHGGERPKVIGHSGVLAETWEALGPSLRFLPEHDGGSSGTLRTYFDVIPPSRSEPPGQNPWPQAEAFEFEGLEVEARENVHVVGKPSCSLKISMSGAAQTAWWSGDSTVDGQYLAQIEPGTSVFFHDCTFVDAEEQVHGAFSELAKLPEIVRRKTVIMHHDDDLEDHRAEVEQLGFRIALPDHVYDLQTGERIES